MNIGYLNPNPVPVNIQFISTGNRVYDYFKIPCATPQLDSCWFLVGDYVSGENCASYDSNGFRHSECDSCWWTTGDHNAASWIDNDLGAYYDSADYPPESGVVVKQVPRYEMRDFLTTIAQQNDTVGGWMNQRVFYRWQPGSWAEIGNDGVSTSPVGQRGVIGTDTMKQDIVVSIPLTSYNLWLGQKLKIACRPFWRWDIIKNGGSVKWFNVQAAYRSGNFSCFETNDNNRTFNSGENPYECTTPNKIFGIAEWDPNGTDHNCFTFTRDGGSPRGKLVPAIRTSRNTSTSNSCPANFTYETYYFARSVVAEPNYKGSYLLAKYYRPVVNCN